MTENYVLDDLVRKAWNELNAHMDEPPTVEQFASDLRTLADQYEQKATDGLRSE